MNIKKYKKLILLLTLFVTLLIYILNETFSMNNLPKGKFVQELKSQNGQYSLKSYFIDGGSLSGDAIRVELINNSTNKIKNIYWKYPVSSVEMKWLDANTVEINKIILNIHKDHYKKH